MKTQTIIFMGPQGSGKGTQADHIARYLREHDPENEVVALETGKYFRDLMSSDNYTGERVKALLDDGKMLPNFLAKHIVLEDLTPKLTATSHLTVDGFPRTVEQIEFWDRLMEFYLREDLAVVFLEVPEKVVRKRLEGRGRFDDTDRLIDERLRLYKEQTLPVIEVYKNRDDINFIHTDGTLPISEISKEICSQLGI